MNPNHLRKIGAPRPNQRAAFEVTCLVAILLLLGAYLLLRYGGQWGENDAATFALAIQAMLESGRLVPSSYVYANGYAYQALSVFIIEVGGLTTAQFQQAIQVFLIAWIALPAWLLYRELTGSQRGATLATAILVVQPELLFPLMRGTHEKLTRGLLLLALYLFIKSLGPARPPARQASFRLAFYLVMFGMVAFNNLLAITLIAALWSALIGLIALRWWAHTSNPAEQAIERRLVWVSLTSSGLALLYTFCLYPPAQSILLTFRDILSHLTSFVLNQENATPALDPYAYTAHAWISQPVYFLLSSANWILLGVSAAIWLWQSLKIVRRRSLAWPPGALLLWAFYGAFALQEVASIVIDFSGALAANLQVRAFPSFVLLGAPVVARALVGWRYLMPPFKPAAWASGMALLAVLAFFAVLKATNEPLVSNKWQFYLPAEMQALDRAGIILHDRPIWTESDERLRVARFLRDPSAVKNEKLVTGIAAARNVLVSDVILARAIRTGSFPPIEPDSLIVYDNGQAQLYHLRPRTPFEP